MYYCTITLSRFTVYVLSLSSYLFEYLALNDFPWNDVEEVFPDFTFLVVMSQFLPQRHSIRYHVSPSAGHLKFGIVLLNKTVFFLNYSVTNYWRIKSCFILFLHLICCDELWWPRRKKCWWKKEKNEIFLF